MPGSLVPGETSFYVIGTCPSTRQMLKTRGFPLAETEEDADAVIWTGGEDISPFLYGQKQMERTFTSVRRDLEEIKFFKQMSMSKPKIGICRGGQLLNVLSGGSMYQDVDNHHGNHDVLDVVSGQLIRVNSIHHQMMIPADNAFLIATAKNATFKVNQFHRVSYQRNHTREWDDPEACYYEHSNSLCVQWHPEYHTDKEPGRDYFFELVEKYCFE